MVVKLQSEADTGSNKPGNYAVQLSASAYWYSRPTKFKVAVLKPKIDRIAVTYPVTSEEDRSTVRDNLKSLADDPTATLVQKWPKRKHWGAVKYARSYGVDVGQGVRVLIQCTAGTIDIAFLRIEFNPERIGPEGVATFHSTLAQVTCGKVLYEDLASLGKVTRIDIASRHCCSILQRYVRRSR